MEGEKSTVPEFKGVEGPDIRRLLSIDSERALNRKTSSLKVVGSNVEGRVYVSILPGPMYIVNSCRVPG